MDQLSGEQAEFLNSIAHENGFKNYDIIVEGQTAKGDGYLGIVKFIKIIETDSSKELNLALKMAHTGEKFRTMTPIRAMYLKEIGFYKTIFPSFRRFQDEQNIPKPFTSVAKFYGALELENNECLLLENIKKAGYSLWNRKIPMNREHVTIVVQEYAKFHGISVAMRHLCPEEFNELTKNFYNHPFVNLNDESVSKDQKSKMKPLFDAAAEGIKRCSEAVQLKFRKFTTNVFDVYQNEVLNPDFQLVLCHGDSWCNNMLFKYNDELKPQKPSAMCFVDWQIAFVASPVVDLAYFLVACSELEVLENIEKYLDVYYNTISDYIRQFDCNPEDVFPCKLFEDHWRRFAKTGLFMALMLTKILLADSEDAPDFEQMAEAGASMRDALHSHTTSADISEKFNSRIASLANILAEKNLI